MIMNIPAKIPATKSEEKMKLLLDGSKMKAIIFYKKFRTIVGMSWEKWSEQDNIKKDNGSEWYCDQDDKFVFSGSAYDPPKLYRKTAPKKVNSFKEIRHVISQILW